MHIILTSIIAFASTNIDDIFILILFFGNKNYTSFQIYVGQYIGVMVLVGISLIGTTAGYFIRREYIGLLGLFPIYLGIRQLIDLMKKRTEAQNIKEPGADNAGFLAVAAVTVANGGDNIGVYIPLFNTMTDAELVILISIFLVMIFVWVSIAKYLTSHPLLAGAISKYGHIVTPIVLCLLGIFILKESGSFALLG
jgi:cadmium resistance transport/sequestration family protein